MFTIPRAVGLNLTAEVESWTIHSASAGSAHAATHLSTSNPQERINLIAIDEMRRIQGRTAPGKH